jgi:hypothetical protein
MNMSVSLGRRAAIAAAVGLVWVLACPSRAQAGDEAADALVGHWRQTKIEFESPVDYHLMLNADGSVQGWQVTASGRSNEATGNWQAADGTLTLRMADGSEASFSYTFHEGQLVMPNIPNQRGFWEKLE